MNIGIVGAGVSGVYLAILISKSHPEYEVTLIEQNDKINKKIYTTGNGRCNLGNTKIRDFSYSNFKDVKRILDKYNLDYQRKFLSSLGIETYEEGNLIYPVSNSAKQVGSILQSHLSAKNVKIIKNCKVIGYSSNQKGTSVKTSDGNLNFDKVIFTTGGKSSPKFGSDGSLIEIFKKHKYEIKDLKPGLCPIKVKENVREIDGCRAKALVTVKLKDKVIHKEEGEVLFKIDGLSGIVIMNCASIISRNRNFKDVKIYLDLISPLNINFESVMLKNYKILGNPLDSLFVPQLSNYIKKSANLKYFDEKAVKLLSKKLRNLEFTFKDLYSFDNSHESTGGISFKDLNEDLSSKIEKNIYFAGQVIDADGLCGGYNLMWCLASAMRINDGI